MHSPSQRQAEQLVAAWRGIIDQVGHEAEAGAAADVEGGAIVQSTAAHTVGGAAATQSRLVEAGPGKWRFLDDDPSEPVSSA